MQRSQPVPIGAISRRSLLAAAGGSVLLTGCQSNSPSTSAPAQPSTPAAPPAWLTPAPVSDTAASGPYLVQGIKNARKIAQLTGPGAMNDTSKVLLAGCDLGHMFDAGDRTYFVFGDNFGKRDKDAVGGNGEIWKSNAVAWTTDNDPTNGISFDGWILDDLDQVKEVLPGRHNPNDGAGEVSKIPTQGFAVGNSLFLTFMSIKQWGEPAHWTANYAGLAQSTDQGKNWKILDVQWPGTSGFVQWAQARVRENGVDYLYIWGVEAGRFGPVRLMRVRAEVEHVTNLASYEYFAGLSQGRARWSKKLADATVVLKGTCGELSALYLPAIKRWVLTVTDGGGLGAVLYESVKPWGPWSKPHEMLDQKSLAGLYAPYMDPRYVSADGRTIYFTLSVWGPYNVFWYAMDLDLRAG